MKDLREQRELTQVALAEAVGITRQSLGAIESGKVDPSVSIALRIARALETPVEDLFGADAEAPYLEAEVVQAGTALRPGRTTLVLAAERWVAHPLPVASHHAADGLILREKPRSRGQKALVEPLRPLAALRENFLVVGCAPALGVLTDRLNATHGPGRFTWIDRPSVEALELLQKRQTHVAGTHLTVHKSPRAGDAPTVRVTFVHWQTGLVVAKGNPLGLHGLDDLARKNLRHCVRLSTAASQRLLEELLRARRLDPARLFARAVIADSHLAAARTVALGAADVTFAMQGAALALDLDFIPLATERFDLHFHGDTASDPRATRALDLMSSGAFRQELRALGGYDTTDCGRVVSV